MYQYRQVLLRLRAGESDREIARDGLMGRRKVAALRTIAAAGGWLDSATALPEDAVLAREMRAGRRAAVVSSLESHRAQVSAWVSQGIQGTTIYSALVRNHGYTGSYSSVRRFVRRLDRGQPRASCVLEFLPGEAAQVDFGSGPKLPDVFTGELLPTWVFVMTLCHSRHQYAEIVRHQDVETWLGCHARAFSWFGGVVERVILDNPKCAITRACYRDPEVQRAYAELAEGYGFKISPCPPREPKKKGIVEAGVKYVKKNFLPLRQFRDIHDANAQLREWVMGEAGNRVHGTTREAPLSRFASVEKPLLKALPAVVPLPAVWAQVKVHGNAHVQFQKCLYSAPFRLMHQRLWLKATAQAVQIYQDLTCVAQHPRLKRPGSRSTCNDHLPPEALAFKFADPQWCLAEAERVGPKCRLLIERLFAHRVLDNLRAAQGVIRMAKRFGAARLEAACDRALAFDAPRYRTVKHILEKGLDQQPALASGDDPLSEVYTGAGHFSRDLTQLLTS
jgi:transposase